MPFDVVQRVVGFMEGFPAPWCIAGGWAIDCFLERTTREHDDLQVALLRQDQHRLREWLAGCRVRIDQGGRLTSWAPGYTLPPPIHEIHALRAKGEPRHIEFLLNMSAQDRFVFRRNPLVALPLSRMIGTNSYGVPYLAPEIVLLYKAKHHSKKDERDFRMVLMSLSGQARIWLRNALRIAHPRHAWVDVLEAPVTPHLLPTSPE